MPPYHTVRKSKSHHLLILLISSGLMGISFAGLPAGAASASTVEAAPAAVVSTLTLTAGSATAAALAPVATMAKQATADTVQTAVDLAKQKAAAKKKAAVAKKKAALAKKKAKAAAMRKRVIKLAKQTRGVRYTYGGTSPRTGFDCSGFTKYTYGKAAHVTLPHSANAQSKLGRRVSAAKVKPGDLVVYSEPGNHNFHVGIYLNKRQIIHAKKPGSVTQIGNLHWGNTTVTYVDVIDPRVGV